MEPLPAVVLRLGNPVVAKVELLTSRLVVLTQLALPCVMQVRKLTG